jgi:hypothetical protein
MWTLRNIAPAAACVSQFPSEGSARMQWSRPLTREGSAGRLFVSFSVTSGRCKRLPIDVAKAPPPEAWVPAPPSGDRA